MSIEHAQAFIEQLKKKPSLRRTLGDLAEGDWQGVVAIGKATGCEFTVEEIRRQVPESFYRGKAQAPEHGWDAKFAE